MILELIIWLLLTAVLYLSGEFTVVFYKAEVRTSRDFERRWGKIITLIANEIL